MVEVLANFTGFPSSSPHRFHPTDIGDRTKNKIEYLQKLGRTRQLLVEAGAIEVQEFFRAVRTYCFDEAEKFLEQGLPVDALQLAGCSLLTERIFARDDFGVDWLLEHGANPNLSPSPFNFCYDMVPPDAIPPIEQALMYKNPRLIHKPTLEEVFDDLRTNELNGKIWDAADGRCTPSPFHPLVACMLADNQPAFEKLLAHGADIHSIAVFHACIPPDWAMERLANLGVDWVQMIGDSEYAAILLWTLQKDSPEKARGLELWERFATPDDREKVRESWKLIDKYRLISRNPKF